MIAPWALLVVGVAATGLAVNVLYPLRSPGSIAIASFFAGWLVGELAVYAFVGQLAVIAALVGLGALAAWTGLVGLVLSTAASGLLLIGHSRARSAHRAVTAALADVPVASAMDGSPRPVASERRIAFHRHGDIVLRLDVHKARGHTGRGPALVYVHGGAWIIGHRERQGLPLMKHLAARGWVCISVDYRLSPGATFPDHIVDVKRALVWVRAHAEDLGVDPSFIAVAGNSAGGHLAALAALTPNLPEYQPGFEDGDTSVDACVGFYGVYNLLDRHGHWPHRGMQRLLERHVMKVTRHEAPEAYDAASPVTRVHADAPPFLLVHGTHDTLSPVDQSRQLFEALRTTSRSPTFYMELPGAQHAFEVFTSARTAHVVDGVTRFLAWARDERRVTAAPERSSGDTLARSSAPPSATRSARA